MTTETEQRGRIVGGILDPTYDRSYYTLVPCPRRGHDVRLDDHRSCQNFGGIHEDADSGAFFLYCRHLEP